MAVNQVVYDGETLMDLTGDTVTPETLLEGATAHAANGERIAGTLSVQSIVDTVLEQVLENDKKKYPVGKLWISESPTNPADILGFGTWEQIKDTFLLAAGSSYSAGSTGGAATVTLTTDQIPAHKHHTGFPIKMSSGVEARLAVAKTKSDHTDTSQVTSGTYKWISGLNNDSVNTSNPGYPITGTSAGGGKAHNNMPPYLAVYVWKRTA